jgi:tetratricopeptide (TPR) repeat protein
MKKILRIFLLILVALPVAAALLVGVLWLLTALPHPPTQAENPGVIHPDYAPRQGTIPWQRDPDHLPQLALTPAWLPWEKMPKNAHVTNFWTPPPLSISHTAIDHAQIAQLTHDLADLALTPAALDRIDHLLPTNPLLISDQLRSSNSPWTHQLLSAGRFADLDRLTEALILPLAHHTNMLESLLNVRTKTALAESRTDLALDRARQWFAIAPLFNTAAAIHSFEEALLQQHQPKPVLRAFRASFLSATPPPTTQPALTLRIDPTSPDARRYLAAANELHAEDLSTLSARANLLLLAGRPDLAHPLFRRITMLATDTQLPAAIENFARCLKADSGTLTTANTSLTEQHP